MHGKARREMWTGKCRWKADLDVEADRSVLFEVIEYLIAWRCDFNANLTYVDYDPVLVAVAVRETNVRPKSAKKSTPREISRRKDIDEDAAE